MVIDLSQCFAILLTPGCGASSRLLQKAPPRQWIRCEEGRLFDLNLPNGIVTVQPVTSPTFESPSSPDHGRDRAQAQHQSSGGLASQLRNRAEVSALFEARQRFSRRDDKRI